MMVKILKATGHYLEFNTGREYTPEGQLIKAKVVGHVSGIMDYYLVDFEDVSRGLRYTVEVNHFNAHDIMREYDANRTRDWGEDVRTWVEKTTNFDKTLED